MGSISFQDSFPLPLRHSTHLLCRATGTKLCGLTYNIRARSHASSPSSLESGDRPNDVSTQDSLNQLGVQTSVSGGRVSPLPFFLQEHFRYILFFFWERHRHYAISLRGRHRHTVHLLLLRQRCWSCGLLAVPNLRLLHLGKLHHLPTSLSERRMLSAVQPSCA